MTWRPDLTVAAVVQRDGRFLIVEERIRDLRVFNQPAGHVEDGESLLAAAVRETFEETAWHFVPQQLLGMYLWRDETSGRSTLRVAICGDVTAREADRRLDRGILAAHWLTREELLARETRLRSPLVLRCVDDYLAGRRYALEALQHVGSADFARSA